jgi:acetyl-CoA synthetase
MANFPEKSRTFPFGQNKVWFPNPEWIRESNLQKFMDRHGIADYDSLMQRSVNEIEWFWEAVLQDLDIRFYRPYRQIIDLSEGIRFPRWCVGGKLNIVHNCLDKWQSDPAAQRKALVLENEQGVSKSLTYADLFREVNRCAIALRSLGLEKGDVVGLFMPMIPEVVIAFLAVIKIGAIVLPLFSGFGASAIASRLNDASAKMLLMADGMVRRGRKISMAKPAGEALREINSVKKVVLVENIGGQKLEMENTQVRLWQELMSKSSTECATVETEAEDILMLIYTSGTTGKPKGAVHTHCGFPIKAAQDIYQCMDFKADEVMFWMSDMGWMMGPWEVFGTLLIGGTLLLYDGAPDVPDAGRVWALVDRYRVTHLGITPSFIRALIPRGTAPLHRHDVSNLRMIGSTGSPWDPESWNWVFDHVLNKKKPIINYSGGTEISGGILSGNLFKPLKPCAFSGPVPGMDADVVDDNGHPVRQEVGELVLRKPWIGMTRGFWKDRQRYADTYWSKFGEAWYHGDYAAIDEDGLWYILGRSDDTIKVAGKRLGPAEVESIVNGHPLVADSAAIGVPDRLKGEAVVIFCVLKEPQEHPDRLRNHLLELVINELGKPLKPKKIRFVNALPKTRNAKVMHRVIRAVYLGENPGDLSSLEDSAAVEAIRQAY